MSCGEGSSPYDSRRNAGKANSLSFHGSPACRFRRYIDEISFHSTRRAGRKIESEAELRQKPQLEAHHVGRGTAWIDEPVEQVHECRMDLRMRVALGQEPTERGEIRHAVKRVRDGQK